MRVRRGTFVLLLLALVVTSCTDPGSHPSPRPAASATPAPQQQCDSLGVFYADVDADHRIDRVYHEYVRRYRSEESEHELGVCTAAGVVSSIEGAGMTESAGVIDIEPDGRDEILYGGTSVCAGFLDIAVFLRRHLLQVFDETGEAMLLEDSSSACNGGKEARSWGCSDVDGDGRRELNVIAFYPATHSYKRTSYRIVGAQARLVDEREGPATEENYRGLGGDDCKSRTKFPDEDECRAANEFVWAFKTALRVNDGAAQAKWRQKLRTLTRELTNDAARADSEALKDAPDTNSTRPWPKPTYKIFQELAKYIRNECGYDLTSR